VSSDQSPPVRKVVPYKPSKRVSTARKLNIDFAGTALEQALEMQQTARLERHSEIIPSITSPTSQTSWTSQTSPTSESNQSNLADPVSVSETNALQEHNLPDTFIPTNSITLPNRTSQSSQSSPTIPSSPSRSTTLTSPTTPSNQSSIQKSFSVAPTRDFMRVANSITREALSAGVFAGKAKQLYDYLYSLTRGAIVPIRSVRLPREKLMEGADIGSIITLRANLQRLQVSGLVVVRPIVGEHEGNEYTIYVPEEIEKIEEIRKISESQTSQTSSCTPTNMDQKLDRLVGSETSRTSLSRSIEESSRSGDFNTSLKTIDLHDDRPLFATIRFLLPELKEEELRTACTEIEKLIAEELQKAANNASSPPISPNYFVECVRRLCTIPRKEGKGRNKTSGQKGNTKTNKERLASIIADVRSSYVGGHLSLEEFQDAVKRACVSRGLIFDLDLFNEIVRSR
jgi:hypothetical protein